MTRQQLKLGRDELHQARRDSRALYWVAGLFSFFTNLLMLTGPLYMIQVYDRVLGSKSVETLIALSMLAAFLYSMMALLDYARGRIMSRVAARFQSKLDRRVFKAVIRKSALRQDDSTATGLSSLETVQRVMSSPVVLAVFDIPWTPLFLIAIWIFHPLLGQLAVLGGGTLVLAAVVNQALSRKYVSDAAQASVRAQAMSDQMRHQAEVLQSLGMNDAAFSRWYQQRATALQSQMQSADISGTFTSITKAFRLFLQSAILGLGAYLVLQDALSPGAMIAASILLGRALAPVEQLIGQWPMIQRALKGWTVLTDLLAEIRPEDAKTALPRPCARLDVQSLTIIPPGQRIPTLKTVSFTVLPGQAIGVIGASGSGKSTLARAITGLWQPTSGHIRLDGPSLAQYDPEQLGRYIGYLPQKVQLFQGTIAENIARLETSPDANSVIQAAKQAGAHDMISRLPDGYDTRITAGAELLSGGQVQRIGLARAMYGAPVVLVLDEPNSNLDNEGGKALNAAIKTFKANGGAVLIMAHRPAAITECETLLILKNGQMHAYGPKDTVLKQSVANHMHIAQSSAAGCGL